MKKFYRVSTRNTLGSNLTELNATDSVSENLFASHNDWLAHLVRYGFIMDKIQKRKATSVLDVGCGKMNLIKYLWHNRSTFSGTYTGLDLRAREPWLDLVGWSKGDVHLVQMDVVLDEIPGPINGQYDIVVCTEVLEHVPHDKGQELVDRLYRWTRAGGACYLSTPNAGVSESTAQNHLDEDGNSREFTYDEKVLLAEAAGFKMTGSWGTFIAMKRMPGDTMQSDAVRKMREFLPYAWFSVLAAGPYPRESNNCIMELSK